MARSAVRCVFPDVGTCVGVRDQVVLGVSIGYNGVCERSEFVSNVEIAHHFSQKMKWYNCVLQKCRRV